MKRKQAVSTALNRGTSGAPGILLPTADFIRWRNIILEFVSADKIIHLLIHLNDNGHDINCGVAVDHSHLLSHHNNRQIFIYLSLEVIILLTRLSSSWSGVHSLCN